MSGFPATAYVYFLHEFCLAMKMTKLNGLVHVIDDDPVSLWHFSEMLKNGGFAFSLYASAADFFAAYIPGESECLVCDLRMPGMDGLQVQKKLRESGYEIPIVFVSGESDVPSVVAAIKNGACDFVEKPVDYKLFLEKIGSLFSHDENQSIGPDDLCSRLNLLTKRERQVLLMVVEGQSSLMIAESLDLSVRTVENHRARIKDKVGVATTVELIGVVYAARDFLKIKY